MNRVVSSAITPLKCLHFNTSTEYRLLDAHHQSSVFGSLRFRGATAIVSTEEVLGYLPDRGRGDKRVPSLKTPV